MPFDDYKSNNSLSFKDIILEVVRVVLISLAIIVPIRYYLVQPFYVKGASMEPNFYDHEYLLIDELTYRFRQPQRGEVIVFRYPLDKRQYFIKRIIGLPGETIEIVDGRVFIYSEEYPQGAELKEDSYLPSEFRSKQISHKKISLGPDEYYVLGDNRALSLDSREFGPVKRDLIIGRVIFRGFPFYRIDTFLHPPNFSIYEQEQTK